MMSRVDWREDHVGDERTGIRAGQLDRAWPAAGPRPARWTVMYLGLPTRLLIVTAVGDQGAVHAAPEG
jgi:hypothetical protein